MKKTLLLFSLLIIFFGALAQPEKMSFKTLTPDMGLSHGDVVCFCQDHEGYLWIGTVDGLNKYNGVSFTVYKYNQKDTTSIPNNCIICIYEDKKNNLWVGTANSDGLCRYNRERDNFERIYYKDEKNKKIENIVTALFEDNTNKLWVSTSNGIYWFDVEKRIFHPCFTNVYGKDILVNFNEIHQDKNGILWFTSEDPVYGGIFKYNPITKETDHYNTQHPIFRLKENAVYSLIIDKNNNIWTGGFSTGLSMINEQTKTILNYQNQPNNKNSLNNNFIQSLAQNSDGKIFIGTNGGGLNVFDPVTKIFDHYTTTKTGGTILSTSIKKLYIGRDGILWMGCWGGGVSIYDKRFEKFPKYKQDKQTGYSFNGVTCFAEDLNGNIWIATDGRGITFFNPKEKKFVRYLSDNNNPQTLTSDKVLAVETDNKGGLWAGMWEGGLNYFQINGCQLILKKKYPYVDKTDPKSNSVFRIYRNSTGEIWVGNFETGAYLFDPKTERFKPMFSLKDTNRSIKANSAIIDILSDYQGDVWFATQGTGLIRLNRKTGKYERFLHDEKDSTSISSNGINVIFEDSKNRLWFGSSGLSLFNRQTNCFTNYSTAQGLTDNLIVGILEDSHHNLWISSDNGISKVTIDSTKDNLKLSFRNYSIQDGLQDKVFSKWAYYKSKSGEMYFGGINGFNAFYPDSIIDNPYLPPVHFTDFLLFNKHVVIGAKNSPLKKHISQTQEVVLNYDQSVFTFRFIALNYIFSEKNQYAYKMEGFDKDWNYIGNKSEATYTNLDPGEYTFRVKASNNDGIWNEKGTSIKITILPPWWQSWWFRILAILTILYSIYSYINYRIHRLEKQKIQLAKMVKERTIQLQEANTSLEEKQEEIFHQNEELQVQKETLLEVNTRLEEKQEEIFHQNEELHAQKEVLQETNRTLEEQNEEIESQRNELYQHHNHLEQLVKERTTELVAALKKAEESDRLKSAFLANMSHEIRTPMNAIVGFSELLIDPDMAANEKENFTLLIRKSSESLLTLINDILDMSKIQANQLIIDKQPINVIEVLKELFETFKLQAQSIGIELILDVGIFGDNLVCSTDPFRFKQILSNLISNALKFTENGFVKFGATIQAHGFITFYVKDTGLGIPKEVGNSIFERFLKIESTKTKLYRGVGLGLSICYNLVHAMDGNIWYESQLGQGTTFYFTMPCGENKYITSSQPNNKHGRYEIPDFSNKQILIVEDEETNYKLLVFFLAKTKATLIWAKDGLEALEIFKNTANIDLILMDLKMPVMDGIEATKLIRQIKPTQLIIAQTAYAYKEEKAEFLKCGFDGYLEKPIIMGKLMKIINEVF
jgi:signal transduction histidine kinase/ligand-binding sensor domain-containing protein